LSAVLLTVGTGAVFAQQPTMDKLKWGSVLSVGVNNTYGSSTGKMQLVEAAYKSISGTVVIPGTYNGNPVEAKNFIDCANITSVIILDDAISISTDAFRGCIGLTSVTIPASVNVIGGNAFLNNSKLTNVTLLGNTYTRFDGNAFPGDLVKVFKSAAGGAGTYTRYAGSDNWTKQDDSRQERGNNVRRHGGGNALNGIWTRNDGTQITISDNGQIFTVTDGNGRFTRTFTER